MVRVVGDNVDVNIYPINKSKEMARQQGLDLVEISPNSDPPVCKIIDYSKFKYMQKKKQRFYIMNFLKKYMTILRPINLKYYLRFLKY